VLPTNKTKSHEDKEITLLIKYDVIDLTIRLTGSIALMSYHPGYVESCHGSCDVGWFRKEKKHFDRPELRYSREFCDALERGDFIPCGSSGCVPRLFLKEGEQTPVCFKRTVSKREATCGFVFGTHCGDKILARRWNCCGQELTGRFEDMLTLKGCKDVRTIPNFTE
jgi:hypothetical protein